MKNDQHKAPVPRRGKKIALWALTVIFSILALGAFSVGDRLSAFFGTLFVALIIPVNPWQSLIRKFLRGKLKTLIAVALAILCFASAGSTEAPDVNLDVPGTLEMESGDVPTTIASVITPPNTIPTTILTTETTEPTAEATTAPTDVTEPTTEPTAPPAVSTFSIHFIDVGQADAALVECDGHYMLIDGGNKADSNVIYSVLKKANVPKLDIVVGTHGHEDHVGGLAAAYQYAQVDLTLCPVTSYDSNAFDNFKKYAEQKGNGITVPNVGDTYSLGSAQIQILGVNGGSDANDTSIILRIDYGKTSFFFTGDAEREAEQAVLNTGVDLSATVLKVGHHGSDTSTTYPFLREIMPQYAVISVGEDNTYGHPTEAALSRLRDAEVEVFRTDMQGDIFCVSDGETVSFRVGKNADADTLGSAKAAETKLEEIVSTACSNYNKKSNRILTGVLTYKIISTTGVELNYAVDQLIYADTEYLVDDVLQEILDSVISDLNEDPSLGEVMVNANANYELSSENASPEPEVTEQPTEEVPEGTDYVGNKNTKKFHYAWCSSVGQMNESNKYFYTGTRDEMIAKGYVPCKKCNP